MSRTRRFIALTSAMLALVLGFSWYRSTHLVQQGEQVPVWTPGSSASGAATPSGAGRGVTGSTTPGSTTPGSTTSASPSAMRTAPPAGCRAQPSPLHPSRMVIDRMGVTAPVLSLGLDGQGSVAVPPFDQPRSVAWYDLGPKPGSAQGKVVITTHTFHAGGALGNQLYDKDLGLRAGDMIRLRDDNAGHVVCYRYSHAVKVMVKDYDPNSTVIFDEHGRPQLAIVICWDYDASTKFWASRIIFYADPV